MKLQQIIFIFLLIITPLVGKHLQSDQNPLSNLHLNALFYSLDPSSISQNFAFYYLYSNTEQGENALKQAYNLINKQRGTQERFIPIKIPALDMDRIISIAYKKPRDKKVSLSDDQLEIIDHFSNHLANRSLQGHHIWEEKDLLSLKESEIDLARALLIYQFDNSEDGKKAILEYEAHIDLMTLQIAAKLSKNPTDLEKIEKINDFIFHEMKFRFPPHSLWAKDVDVYTFLPSVLDSRKGVCLGVSILYLSIAQRLNLNLDIVTPPGHIYLAYPTEEGIVNIETTARGISMPSKTYLGMNTISLQQRRLKEVIGLAFINQASTFWEGEEYEKAIELYNRALIYIPNDPLTKMFLGYNYLFVDDIKNANQLLSDVVDADFPYLLRKDTIPEDYLKGRASVQAIKTIFSKVDQSRKSILDKQAKLKQIVQRYPKFREALFQLAVTYLQLSREQEALDVLKKYQKLDPKNPTALYYLSILCMQRYDFEASWKYFLSAQMLAKQNNHDPICLKSLKHGLRKRYPNPYLFH